VETSEVSPEEVQATPAKGAVWGKGGRFVKKAETAAAVKAA
jgi:hypothetical protein